MGRSKLKAAVYMHMSMCMSKCATGDQIQNLGKLQQVIQQNSPTATCMIETQENKSERNVSKVDN